jgi:hypothetical protein
MYKERVACFQIKVTVPHVKYDVYEQCLMALKCEEKLPFGKLLGLQRQDINTFAASNLNF